AGKSSPAFTLDETSAMQTENNSQVPSKTQPSAAPLVHDDKTPGVSTRALQTQPQAPKRGQSRTKSERVLTWSQGLTAPPAPMTDMTKTPASGQSSTSDAKDSMVQAKQQPLVTGPPAPSNKSSSAPSTLTTPLLAAPTATPIRAPPPNNTN